MTSCRMYQIWCQRYFLRAFSLTTIVETWMAEFINFQQLTIVIANESQLAIKKQILFTDENALSQALSKDIKLA